MKLLTDELRAQLPPLYAQEHEDDAMIYAKFFTPWTGWTWFVTEGSQEEDDFIFFGYVIGLEAEWGYFSLGELESVRVLPDLRSNRIYISLPSVRVKSRTSSSLRFREGRPTPLPS